MAGEHDHHHSHGHVEYRFCPHCGGTPQLSILQGAMGTDTHAELLAYAAPSYYGMAVAEVIAAS